MLEQATAPPRPWYVRYRYGIITVALGVVALLVGSWFQFNGDRGITKVPDPRFTLPLLGFTLVPAVFSLVRRERLRWLPALGVGLAVAAVALGWFLVLGAVAVVTALVIVIILKFN